MVRKLKKKRVILNALYSWNPKLKSPNGFLASTIVCLMYSRQLVTISITNVHVSKIKAPDKTSLRVAFSCFCLQKTTFTEKMLNFIK